MAYTTIKKPTDYFNPKIYTGTGSSNAITGVGFQPDLVWIKQRSGTEDNVVFDVLRTAAYRIYSNSSAAQTNSGASTRLVSFDSDGFTEGGDGMTGNDGSTYVSWNWKANGAGSLNEVGSIDSTVSVNTTSGFSIVKYTGNEVTGATVGHGLGAVPQVIIIKKVSQADDWFCYFESLGNTKKISLNTTDASASNSSYWNNTSPTSSVFTLGANGANNASGQDHIAYCFRDVVGYQKFGRYKGNGENDGAFVYLGFRPAYVMIKKDGADGWQIFDNKRDTYNPEVHRIEADSNAGDYTGLSAGWVDFLSNGFKVRYSGGGVGSSGSDYLFMAFAAQPLVGDNPATAR